MYVGIVLCSPNAQLQPRRARSSDLSQDDTYPARPPGDLASSRVIPEVIQRADVDSDESAQAALFRNVVDSESKAGLPSHAGRTSADMNVAAVRAVLRAAPAALQNVNLLPGKTAFESRRAYDRLSVVVYVTNVGGVAFRNSSWSCGQRRQWDGAERRGRRAPR